MSPRVANSKRHELPKSVIKPNSLGFLPLNAISATYLQGGHGEAVVGYYNTPFTQMLKTNPQVTLVCGTQKEGLSLEGQFFNGYADALYRGKLPQVMIVSLHASEFQTFLMDFVDYVSKMLALGFFLPKKELIKRDPVEDMIPCFLLAGDGLLFSHFLASLMRFLSQLEHQFPVMDSRMRQRILGRFVRAVAADDGQLSLENSLEEAPSRVMDAVPLARRLKVAGGNRRTLELIQSVLSLNGLVTVVENRVQNAVERLELEQTLWRLSAVVVPAVAPAAKSDEAQRLQRQLEKSILKIGQARLAFDETEGPAKQPKSLLKGMSSPIGNTDALSLNRLRQYADALGLQDESRLFEQLGQQISDRL